jgi:hypothetical protein
MSLKRIRGHIATGKYLYSNKIRRRIASGIITTQQIRETVLKGTRRKAEVDERSKWKFIKYTVHWRNWYVVVKNTTRPFLITAGRLD